MPDFKNGMGKETILAFLNKILPDLSPGQLYWLQEVSKAFTTKSSFEIFKTDLFDKTSLQNFGDAIRVHHVFSAEPFSKDKFEFLLVKILCLSGRNAKLSPKGNPGHDVTIDNVRLSLKTQADRSIKNDEIWISKFMELGKGQWGKKEEDLNGLLKQFLTHLNSYDRILTLRALEKGPNWKYELVEIPKKLLERAKHGSLKMMMKSKQLPKPGYCYVQDDSGELLFELYFDGGGERKLQIKSLKKKNCVVHATWNFSSLTD